MRRFNRNLFIAVAVFLLALLMQSIRKDALCLSEALPLGLWYAVGLAGAALVGRAAAIIT